MDKWDKLYNYINDWAFGVAPDETTPINEVRDRLTIYVTLNEVLDIMRGEEDAN